MGLRGWVKKTKKKAERDLNKAGKAVENTANKVGGAIDDTANKAFHEAERLAHEAERLGMSVIDDIKNLKGQIEHTANKARSDIEAKAKDAQKTIGEAKALAQDVKHELECIPGAVDKAITDQLPTALKGLLDDIASGALKPALKLAAKLAKEMHRGLGKVREKHPDLIAEIDGLGATIPVKLNVEIKLTYSGFYKRAEEISGVLDRYGNEGLKPRRRDIRGFLAATMATSIDFGGGAAITFGIDAGVKVLLNKISSRLFILLVDTILEEMGVPE